MKTFINDVESFFDNDILHIAAGDALIESNGCSYNFNRTTDVRCFKAAISRALGVGTRELAFDVYFSFAEIFKIFDCSYDRIDVLLETLMEYEENSGRLVDRHRDHYMHSVYVFALGLVFYQNNKKYRNTYKSHYRYISEKEAKAAFLYDWGMCSLFHDIGYPFEMTHQQIIEYTDKLGFICLDDKEKDKTRRFRPDFGINNPEEFAEIVDNIEKVFAFLPPQGEKNINDILAYDIANKLNINYIFIKDLLANRIRKAKYRMDHAYFSAVILFKTLLHNSSESFRMTKHHIDICSAILLHNNLFKYEIREKLEEEGEKYKLLRMNQHPLAFLLMLCDELQCWDRTAYGKMSRTEVLPFDFILRVNDSSVGIKYRFCKEEVIEKENRKENRLYNSIVSGSFGKKITENILDYTEMAFFIFETEVKDKPKKPEVYLSASKYSSLFHFAMAINESYLKNCEDNNLEGMKRDFLDLTLEYKLSNIAQARSYAKKLDKINCFFSDVELDYERIECFGEEELQLLAREEHIRWVREKLNMGWSYGTEYENRIERESKRIHRDIIPYDALDNYQKDIQPIKNMIKILNEKANGVHIYRLFKTKQNKTIGFTGHRNIANTSRVYWAILNELTELKRKFNLQAICMFAKGSDVLFAKAAYEIGIPVKAVIPKPLNKYIQEDFLLEERAGTMALLAQTTNCVTVMNNKSAYKDAGRQLIKESDILLCLWDGIKMPFKDTNENPINQGGTYYNICYAQNQKKDIIRIDTETV